MLSTLKSRGESFFRAKGILDMLERNVKIKDVPERWQEHKNVAKFEVVVCFEERVFDILLEDLHCRTAQGFRTVHVVNIDTRDNAQASIVSGGRALDFCRMCEEATDLDEEMPDIVTAVANKYGIQLLHVHALL